MANQIVCDTYNFNLMGGCPVNFTIDNLRGGISLIESELEETQCAVDELESSESLDDVEEALVELADGAADIVVTAIGLLYRAGFSERQVEDILFAVGQSNNAKFDFDEEDAIKSVESYANDDRYFDVTYEETNGGFVVVGKVATVNGVVRKILKSHKWKGPEEAILKTMREGY